VRIPFNMLRGGNAIVTTARSAGLEEKKDKINLCYESIITCSAEISSPKLDAKRLMDLF
jgi:hypothetical protein